MNFLLNPLFIERDKLAMIRGLTSKKGQFEMKRLITSLISVALLTTAVYASDADSRAEKRNESGTLLTDVVRYTLPAPVVEQLDEHWGRVKTALVELGETHWKGNIEDPLRALYVSRGLAHSSALGQSLVARREEHEASIRGQADSLMIKIFLRYPDIMDLTPADSIAGPYWVWSDPHRLQLAEEQWTTKIAPAIQAVYNSIGQGTGSSVQAALQTARKKFDDEVKIEMGILRRISAS